MRYAPLRTKFSGRGLGVKNSSKDLTEEIFSKQRRRLLLGSAAWIGGLTALASAKPAAAAFQEYKIAPKSELGLALANRCKANSDHEGLTADLRRQLANDPSVSALTETCPICGCPVTVTR